MKFAEFYDAHHSMYTEDIPFWKGLAEEYGGPVLELGAGTGRVTLPLHLAGYKIVGLDYDLEMLQKLQKNAPINSGNLLQLICGDFLSLPIQQKFKLIIFPCNTFSTLEITDRQKLLGMGYSLLEDGGCFTASFPNPAIMEDLPAESDLEVEEVIEFPDTGTPLQISSGWQKKGKVFTLRWGYDLLRLDGMVEHLEVRTRHIIQAAEDVAGLFSGAGFSMVQLWGDYDKSPFTNESPYLIISALK